MASNLLLPTLISTLVLSLPETAVAKVIATQLGPRVVETQYGKLRGVLTTLSNRHLPPVDAYYGLQYASVTGSELRFMPPTSPTDKWPGIRVAHNFKPVCPQPTSRIARAVADWTAARTSGTGTGSHTTSLPWIRWNARYIERLSRLLPFVERQHEECLYLNVYVPVVDRGGDSNLLPVVLFVHGESYEFGTGNAYDGSVLAASGHVIVVTFNYRLGVFGFLSTGDSNAPGNYALLDQVAALRWIQENIRAFGGNPNEVTLMGHGYGAALVNLLMISPVTKGRSLFRRAILQSGSALNPFAVLPDPLPYTWAVASKLNCSAAAGSSDPPPAPSTLNTVSDAASSGGAPLGGQLRLLHCLKQVPVEALVAAADYVDLVVTTGGQRDFRSWMPRAAFGPTIDRRTLPTDDLERLMVDRGTNSGNEDHTSQASQIGSNNQQRQQIGSAHPSNSDGASSTSPSSSVFANVSLLIGFAVGEGPASFMTSLHDGIHIPRDGQLLGRAVRAVVNSLYVRNRQTINDVLMHQYTDWSRLDAAVASVIRDRESVSGLSTILSSSGGVKGHGSASSSVSEAASVAEMLMDALFASPAINVAGLHSTPPSAQTYLYLFNYTAASMTSSTAAISSSSSSTSLLSAQFYRSGLSSHSKSGSNRRDLSKQSKRRRSTLDIDSETDSIHHPPLSASLTSSLAAEAQSSAGGMPVSDDLLMYVFGAPVGDGVDPFTPTTYSRHDRAVSELVMKYWTNFIRTGNPNDPLSQPGGSTRRSRPLVSLPTMSSSSMDLPDWPAYDSTSQQYMVLDAKPTIRRRYRAHQMALWLDLVPRLHRSSNMDAAATQDDDDVINPPVTWCSNRTSDCAGTGGTTLASPAERRRDVTSFPPSNGQVPPPPSRTSGQGRRVSTTTSSIGRLHAAVGASPTSTPAVIRVSTIKWQPVTGTGSTDYSVSLISTVTAGCLLLTVNVIVLTCFCYKRKVRRWQRDIDAMKWASRDDGSATGCAGGGDMTSYGTQSYQQHIDRQYQQTTFNSASASSDIGGMHGFSHQYPLPVGSSPSLSIKSATAVGNGYIPSASSPSCPTTRTVPSARLADVPDRNGGLHSGPGAGRLHQAAVLLCNDLELDSTQCRYDRAVCNTLRQDRSHQRTSGSDVSDVDPSLRSSTMSRVKSGSSAINENHYRPSGNGIEAFSGSHSGSSAAVTPLPPVYVSSIPPHHHLYSRSNASTPPPPPPPPPPTRLAQQRQVIAGCGVANEDVTKQPHQSEHVTSSTLGSTQTPAGSKVPDGLKDASKRGSVDELVGVVI